jgi:NAD(P)-dependent dehydrogenase (short-subunit alcohol dehydrogenase family)
MTAALECAPRHIRVNAIAPASIDTPLLAESFRQSDDAEAARAVNVQRHPLGRLGAIDDCTELAIFLCSSAAGWITGSIHQLDGGASITRR